MRGVPVKKGATKEKLARELHASQRKERTKKLAAAKGKSRALRTVAVETCKTEKQAAKEKCERVRVPATEARAERERIAKENREMRAAEKTRKGLRPLKRTSGEARTESDDVVRANLRASHPEYVDAFERIKQSVKASPNRSRTEAAIELIEADDDLMRQVQESQFEAGEAMMRRRYGNPKTWPKTGNGYPVPAFKKGDVITRGAPQFVGATITGEMRPEWVYPWSATPGRVYLYRVDRPGSSGDVIKDMVGEEAVWEVRRGKRTVTGPYQPSWAKRANPKKSNGRDALPATKRGAFKAFHWGKDSTKEQSVMVPDPTHAELYALGELVEVVYETTKGTERAEYEHKTRARPLLMVDAKDPHAFFIAVSTMKNTTRGIVG